MKYSIEDYEQTEFYEPDEDISNHKQKIVKVRKTHECAICQKDIQIGEQALRESSLNKSLFNICPYCLGTGKLKAMQMAMTYDAGTIRTKDTKVKCNHCKGTGRKEA